MSLFYSTLAPARRETLKEALTIVIRMTEVTSASHTNFIIGLFIAASKGQSATQLSNFEPVIS